jgi:hypothetical protein
MNMNNMNEIRTGGSEAPSIFALFIRYPVSTTGQILFFVIIGVPFLLGWLFGYVPENAGILQGLAQTVGLAFHRATAEAIQTTGPIMKNTQESLNESTKDLTFSPSVIEDLNNDTP